MKYYLTFLACWFCLTNQILAQWAIPDSKDALALQKMTLLVALPELDRSVLEKLKDQTEEHDLYRSFIHYHSNAIQESVGNYWKFNEKIEFKPLSEAEKLFEQYPSKYGLLKSSWAKRRVQTGPDLYTDFPVYNIFVSIRGKKDMKLLTKVTYETDLLSPGDYRFIMEQLNIYLEAGAKGLKKKEVMNVEENLATLSTKTLLLTKSMMDASGSDMEESYEHAFKIVETDEIERAILEKDKQYAYLNLIWSNNKNTSAFIAVDAETQRVLSIVTVGGIHFSVQMIDPIDAMKELNLQIGNINLTFDFREEEDMIKTITLFSARSNMKLDKAHLKYFTKKFAQKLNN